MRLLFYILCAQSSAVCKTWRLPFLYLFFIVPNFSVAQDPVFPSRNNNSTLRWLVDERQPDGGVPLIINIPTQFGDEFIFAVLNTFKVKPSKGIAEKIGNLSLRYTPHINAEGEDELTWKANTSFGNDRNFTLKININPSDSNDPAIHFNAESFTQIAGVFQFNLPEEQNLVTEKIQILDPDFTGGSVDVDFVQKDDSNFTFEFNPVPGNQFDEEGSGQLYTATLKWKHAALPDFETLGAQSWPITLRYSDSKEGYPDNGNKEISARVTLAPVDETPQLVNNPSEEIALYLGGDKFDKAALVDLGVYKLASNDSGRDELLLTESNEPMVISFPLEVINPDFNRTKFGYHLDYNLAHDDDGEIVGFDYADFTDLPTVSIGKASSLKALAPLSGAISYADDKVTQEDFGSSDIVYVQISFPNPNFYTIDGHPLKYDFFAVSESGKSLKVHSLMVQVENDFADPIQIIDNPEWQTSDEYVNFFVNEASVASISYGRFDTEDNDTLYGNFDETSDIQGAKKIYSLSFDEEHSSEFIKIDSSTGIVSLKKAFNYEVDEIEHIFTVKVQDRNDDQATSDLKKVKFIVRDLNDVPVISSTPLVSASTDEGISIDLLNGEFRTEVLDEDGSAGALDENISLSISTAPGKGKLFINNRQTELKNDGSTHYLKRSTTVSQLWFLDDLFYEVFDEAHGTDLFKLSFQDQFGKEAFVDFNISIRNSPSPPRLTDAWVDEEPVDVGENIIEIKFDETGGREFYLAFDDESDQEQISEIRLVINSLNSLRNLPFEFDTSLLDKRKLNFYSRAEDGEWLDKYIAEDGENSPAWVRFSTKEGFSWDRDSEDSSDYNVSIKIDCFDASYQDPNVDEALSRLSVTLNFIAEQVDEAPDLAITDLNIFCEEEQNTVIHSIEATDPEGVHTDFFWSLQPGSPGLNDNELFYISMDGGISKKTQITESSSVGLFFKDTPNIEEGRSDFNCTLRLKDHKNANEYTDYTFFITLEEIDDPPRPVGATDFNSDSQTYSGYSEHDSDSLDASWAPIDLNQFYRDEDSANLNFSLSGPSALFSLTEQGVLSFKQPLDYEENPTRNVPFILSDGENEIDFNFTIALKERNEAPIYRIDPYSPPRFQIEEDTHFNASSLFSALPDNHTLDEGQNPNRLSYYIFDPEDEGITIQSVEVTLPDGTMGDSSSSFRYDRIGSDDYNFTFSPLANTAGLFTVKLAVRDNSDLQMEKTEAFLEFNVTEVPDLPRIITSPTIESIVLDPSSVDYPEADDFKFSELPDDFRLIFADEGKSDFLSLNADDLYDKLSPHTEGFYWELTGADSQFFILTNNRTAREGMVTFVKWKTLPDYGSPPAGRDKGGPFTLTIRLSETEEGLSNNAEYVEEFFQIYLHDVQNEPPQITTSDSHSFSELITKDYELSDLALFTLEAIDPDRSDSDNSPLSEIDFEIVNAKGDSSKFDLNHTNGQISFNISPDWENPEDINADNDYELYVRAKKYYQDSPGFSYDSEDYKITVVVENTVEAPSFETYSSVEGSQDANFSVEEQTEGHIFPIEAFSNDGDNSLVTGIRLEENDGNDNAQFIDHGWDFSGFFPLQFKTLPDFENKRDKNEDDIYEVTLIAQEFSSDQKTPQGPPTVEVFRIEVLDKEFPLTIKDRPLTSTISENSSFVLSLQTEDEESIPEEKDLLWLSSEGLSYNKIVASVIQEEASLITDRVRSFYFSDMRNSGVYDVIVASDNNLEPLYFLENDGSGGFQKEQQYLADSISGIGLVNRLITCDYDQDGDSDIILSEVDSSELVVLKSKLFTASTTSTNLEFEKEILLDQKSENIKDFILSDVDGDFDVDLIIAYESDVVWYENVDGVYQEIESILGEINSPNLLAVFNLDDAVKSAKKDPFLCPDLVVFAGNGIYLFRYKPDDKGEEDWSSLKLSDIEIGALGQFAFADLDNSGAVDLLLIDDIGDASYVLLKQETGQVANIEASGTIANGQFSSIQAAGNEAETYPRLYLGKNEGGVDEYAIDAAPELMFEFKSPVPAINETVSQISFVDLDRKINFISYELVDGKDKAFFDEQKLRSSGRLFFKSPPDYETPKGTFGGNDQNKYHVTVKASIASGVSDEASVVVTVDKVDEPPSLVNVPLLIDHNESVPLVFPEIEVNNPEEEQAYLIKILQEDDGGLFKVDRSSGRLEFRDPPDFDEGQGEQQYLVHLRVQEVENPLQSTDHVLTINLLDGYELPFFNPSSESLLLDANGSVLVEADEDDDGIVLRLSDFNPSDSNNDLLYSAAGPPIDLSKETKLGIDSSSYRISQFPMGGTAWVGEDNTTLHYLPDADYYGTDHFVLEVKNFAGHAAYQKVVFNISGKPDGPRSTTAGSISVPEGQRMVTPLSGYDPDYLDSTGSEVSWRVHADFSNTFEIQSNVLYFKEAPDYEDPNFVKNSGFEVILILESDGDEAQHTLKIDLENISDEFPTSILDANQTVVVDLPENQVRVVDLQVSDPDGMADSAVDFIVRLEDSPDHRSGLENFEIIWENNKAYLEVIGLSGLDYEIPKDTNKNNRYEVTIFIGKKLLSGGESGRPYKLIIKVTDADETKPYFTSAEGGDLLETLVLENQKFAAQVTAKDEIPGTSLSYELSGGEDVGLFRINELNGTLEFITPPNFEKPLDANRDNQYKFTVMATDGTFKVEQSVHVDVNDSNDFPNVVDAYFQGTEDEVFEGQLAFEDEDGDVWEFVNYTLPENNGTLELYADYSFTYTPPKDFASVDTFSIILSDPYGQGTSQVQIAMAPVNDPPVAETDYVYYTDLKKSNRLQFNVLSNDHAGPDFPAVESYQFVSHTQTDYAAGLVNLGGGSFSYTPQSGFLGEDTFTYVVADQNDSTSRSTGTVRIWIAKTATLPDWTYLRNFGAYLKTKNNWVFHENLGWLYVAEPREIIYSTSWMWSETIGWFWTGEKYFNWIYHDEHEKWLHWQGSLLKNKSWFLRDKEEKIYDRDHFIRLDIRDEVIEILPDLAELSTYIANSTYFNRSQKGSIITELNRFKRSSTLNQILEFDFQY